MVELIIEVLWLYSPAIIANMIPVFAARYNWAQSLNKPVDGGYMLCGARVFGDNKTIRGFVFGIIAGGITGAVQWAVIRYTWFDTSLLHEIGSMQYIALGCALGAGALLGDVVKSFVKRQLRIAPGKSFPIFDQIDFVIGATIVMRLFLSIPVMHVVLAVLIIGVGSLLVSSVGVLLGIKKSL